MKRLNITLPSILQRVAELKHTRLLTALCFALFALGASAQTDYLTRYVAIQTVVDGNTHTGSYSNDGLSWSSPKANIQDAINDLHEYMTAEGITEGGKVYVASGTYTPTESTEESGGTTLNLSFKIYSGITLYGGFNSDAPEADPDNRVVVDRGGNLLGDDEAHSTFGSHTKGNYLKPKYPTILSGNLNTNRKSSLTWNDSQQKFTSVMPGNVYHVVTFATNGFNSNTQRANALSAPAAIDGFTIQYGNANNTDPSSRYHTAYGGGVYAVGNSTVINCEVRQCSAARDGGGVYCDGGGTVKQCYIHTCQATGIGIQYGNGGGAMLDGAGFVNTTVLANNYARQGGGLAMTDASTLGNNNKYNYQATSSASLIVNNTSASEGGGIYMEKGGAINGMSIYNNRCNGTGITVNGLTNGQSAGIYAGPMSRIYNSAMWGGNINGGTDDASKVQYATSANEGGDRSRMYFCMLSHHDVADWTYTYKKEVDNLTDDDKGTDSEKNYIALKQPSTAAGVVSNDNDDDAYLTAYNWQPEFYSAIANAGVQLMDIPDETGVNVNNAKLVTDLLEQEFSADTDLGAIVAEQQNGGYTTGVPYYDEADLDNPTFDKTKVYTIFVDPKRNSTTKTNSGVGTSWANPMRNARKALAYFQSWKDSNSSLWSPYDATDNPDGYKYQILVKAGTLYTPISTGSGRARSDSWWLDDHVAVVGGYPKDNTDKSIENRQPTANKTYISGNVSKDGFDYCSANLVQIGNVTGAILDGFTLTMGNAVSKEVVGWSNGHGAGIVVRNDSTMYDKNNDSNWKVNGVGGTGEATAISMVNTIKNCVFSNLGAYEGAAIYMTAQSGTTSKVIMENCIFRNCGANFDSSRKKTTTAISSTDGKNHSIVYVGANTTLNMDHCDVLKNVGYGVLADNGGTVNATNSVFYANLDREVTETDNFDTKTDATLLAPVKVVGTGSSITGSYNLFDSFTTDWKAITGFTDATGSSATLTYNPSNTLSTTYPRFGDPTTNCGITEDGGDVTYYGGSANFMPMDMNPMTNAASTTKMAADGTINTVSHAGTSSDSSWGTDLHLVNRDYGGLPDIGAVENYYDESVDGQIDKRQQKYGAVLYVRDYRDSYGNIDYTKGGDGSSWSLAINGNAQYNQSTGALVGETQTAGTTINGLQFAVNKQSKSTNSSREVWVAAGTYRKDPETVAGTFELENGGESSCFVIRNGVNVYGAFPKVGNPSKSEKQPLVSQYVKVVTGYSPDDYETILEPISTTPTVGKKRRVLGQPRNYNPKFNTSDSYGSTIWDGFTLRNGNFDAGTLGYDNNSSIMYAGREGGAGACFYEGVTLQNMVVTNNICFETNTYASGDSGTHGIRAGGAYMDQGTLISSYLINNKMYASNATTGEATEADSPNGYSVCYGGGMYLYSGTMYNCISAHNYIHAAYADGAGLFLELATFFNNTVVNNYAKGSTRYSGGITIYNSSGNSTLNMYNSISYNNTGFHGITGSCDIAKTGGTINCHNCLTSNVTSANDINYYDCLIPSSMTSLFVTSGADYSANFANSNYRLTSTASQAINTGDPEPVVDKVTYHLSEYTDMDYADRIQDCAIDIGAYEYNGAQDITPDVDTDPGTAFFYVTQNGRGDRTGVSPDNAACMEKIQKVLDAAGRYKYQNAGTHVVVKLAAIPQTGSYKPQRSVEPAKDDPRSYSILVPRGVELWGGYTDDYDADAGTSGFDEENRDILSNNTIINGFYNIDSGTAYAYHVIQFTDYVFDADGYPYTTSDEVGGTSSISNSNTELYSSMSNLRLMSDVVSSERGVVDGIFIEGGQATAGSTTSTSVNENQYGGGVIINDFGHVRNCVLDQNEATNGGGAVYIKKGGIISGCLLKGNTAAYGGAIYVEQLDEDEASEEYPDEMAQIVTCTITGNTAYVAGGGIWFYNNTRVNSTVVWDNSCSDQANVSGQTSSAYSGTLDAGSIYAKYPFSYSAVQNVRLAGTNNISVATENNKGVRFLDTDFYPIDDYSVLNNVAMPITLYQSFMTDYDVAESDYAKVARITDGSSFIDIGARSNEALTSVAPTSPDQLLLRLFVAQPADVDYDLMQAMRNSGDAIYSKIGSSFAYPMQHLDDALEYIRNARQSTTVVKLDASGNEVYMKDYAANLPFEIIMSRGTFYPQIDIQGNYGYSNANTFLVPEGVSIMGGFECGPIDADSTQYIGQDRKGKSKDVTYSYNIYDNTDALSEVEVKTGSDTTIEGGGEMLAKPRRVQQRVAENKSPRKAGSIDDGTGIYDKGSGLKGITMMPYAIRSMKKLRERSDNNANGIYEPWEFYNQTILSGKIVNTNSSSSGNNAAYHVITVIADENYTGERPKLCETTTTNLKTGMQNSAYTTSATGTVSHEMGQAVFLDGLQIQDGYAAGYIETAVSGNSAYSYFSGGGVLVDGNWYSEVGADNQPRSTYKHQGVSQSVGYRDIPLSVTNCVFTDNTAGYGGAISTNGTLKIYNSTFSQNVSVSGQDAAVSYSDSETGLVSTATVQYPGAGGCIFFTKNITALNSLFANNESQDPTNKGKLMQYKNIRNAVSSSSTGTAQYGGAGGVVFAGRLSTMHIMNCDFVKNKSTYFPAIYTMHPNGQAEGVSPTMGNYNEILNCIFWGNEATSTTTNADMVVNMAKYGSYTSTLANTTSTPSYPNVIPTTQTEMDDDFAPTMWFCSYEQGTAVTPLYTYDLRNASYDMSTYIPDLLKAEATSNQGVSETDYTEQNCNIILNSENTALDGPDFASPSVVAGADGYMASADWSLSRANNIVDNGWGKLEQNIDQAVKNEVIDYAAIFFKKSGDKYVGTGAYYTVHYADDNKTFYDSNFTTEDKTQMGDAKDGSDRYMYYTTTDDDDTTVEEEMFRISHDPNPTHQQTYIDMGVYEYIHTELEPTVENETDILWVATEEKMENGSPDGSCWEQPTSDLQRAIETLLASRNGHAKEIRITDGEYSPIYTMGNEKLLTFYINTENLNAQSEILANTDLDQRYVKSLRITGGWAKDWKMTDDSERSLDEYPAVLHSVARSGVGTDKLNAVFLIEDARQWYGVTAAGKYATLTPTESINTPSVIPITIDGVQFVNGNALAGVQGSAFKYADQKYYTYTGSDNKTVVAASAPSSGTYTEHEAIEPTTGDLRLTLNHINVAASGNITEATASGVSLSDLGTSAYVGTGGGDALIYNSLFHDNYNHPLKAYNTRVVNCTFGQNQGIVQLLDTDGDAAIGTGTSGDSGTTGPMLSPRKAASESENHYSATSRRKTNYALGSGSCMHNSVLWKNNLACLAGKVSTVSDGVTSTVTIDGFAAGTAGNGTQILFCDASQNYWTPTSTQTAAADPASNTYATYTFATSPKFTYNATSDTYHYNDNQYELHELAHDTDGNQNYGLSLDNSDAIYGPSFTDVDNETLTDRDYHLQPSVRLMNQGSNDTYTAVVGVNPTTSYTTVVTFNDANTETTRETTTTVYDAEGKNSTTTTTTVVSPWYEGDKEGVFTGYETELGSDQRVQAVTIDRGAYEYQEALTRVVYVDPTQRDGKGTSWAETYSGLQKAIDLVAVYYNTYGQKAYVFSKVGRMNENIIVRDGVEVYGSIPRNYSKETLRNASIEAAPGSSSSSSTDWTDDTDLIEAYAHQVRDDRDGLALPTTETSRTIINGLSNSSSIYTGTSLIDGFDIHGGSTEGITKVTAPVINFTSSTGEFVVRNCIIRDNQYTDATLTTPVVYLSSKSLLYNVLLRNNVTANAAVPVVQMANDDAYAVNITDVTSGTYAIGGTAGQLINSITWSTKNSSLGVSSDASLVQTNNNTLANGYPFANYLTDQSVYSSYPNIWYQLSENSVHIDQCVEGAKAADDTRQVGSSSTKATIPSYFASYINYAEDRDVLGNPRSIDATNSGTVTFNNDSYVDRGCFETWRVGTAYTKADPASASATTNIATIQSSTVYTKATNENDDPHKYTENITSDFPYYPHTGSVVYVMPGSSLVLGEYTYTAESGAGDDAVAASAANPLRDYRDNGNEYVFRPSYLLMKVGASLYGQGNNVSVPYLSIERYFKNGTTATSGDQTLHYNGLMSLPFPFHYGEDPKTVTYAATTCIPSLTESKDQPVYHYDATSRAAWDNIFHTTSSDKWTELTGSAREREANEGILFSPSLASGAEALYRFSAITTDFTSTDNDVYEETQEDLSKNVTLTQNDDRAAGDVNSLNAGTESSGDATFTSKEDMGWNCIGLPYLIGKYYTAETSNYSGTDAANTANVTASSVLGAIGAEPNQYMLHVPKELWLYYNDTDAYEKKNSWDATTGNAVYVMSGEGFFTQTAAINSTETVTFTLPIWLDGSSTNAAKSPVFSDQSLNEIDAIPGVRLGGTPEETSNDTVYRVYSTQGTIHAKGLTGTEQIRIYTTSGALYNADSAPVEEYSHSVAPGTYIVRINNQSWKLLVR